jgi:hypothetical protein
MLDKEARHESMESEGNITTAASKTIKNFESVGILYRAFRSCRFSSSTNKLDIFFRFLN